MQTVAVDYQEMVLEKLAQLRTTAKYLELLTLLKERSFQQGDFTLRSGEKSTFYLDARKTTLSPLGTQLVGELMWALIQETPADFVSGLTMGADPIITSIVYASQLDAPNKPIGGFMIRKEPKGHGTLQQVEGLHPTLDKPKKIILVEDVTTTGSSIQMAYQAIVRDVPNADVILALSLVDRRENKAPYLHLVSPSLPFVSLYNLEQFFD